MFNLESNSNDEQERTQLPLLFLFYMFNRNIKQSRVILINKVMKYDWIHTHTRSLEAIRAMFTQAWLKEANEGWQIEQRGCRNYNVITFHIKTYHKFCVSSCMENNFYALSILRISTLNTFTFNWHIYLFMHFIYFCNFIIFQLAKSWCTWH